MEIVTGESSVHNLYFQFVDRNSPHFIKLCSLFDEIIVPIYGDQTGALSKIGRGLDRSCEMLFEDKEIRGVLVYKRHLTDKFATHGITKTIELKTLFVIDPNENVGRGFGTRLLDRVLGYALSMDAENIAVTVSTEKPDAYRFFKNHGFEQVALLRDRYKPGINESILARSLRKV